MEKRTATGAIGSALTTTGVASIIAGVVNQIPWLWGPGAVSAIAGVGALATLFLTAKKPMKVEPVDPNTPQRPAGLVDEAVGTVFIGNKVVVFGDADGIRMNGVDGTAVDNDVTLRP